MENWNFQMLANRQHFQILPNSPKDLKLRWLSFEKESSNEQEWGLDVLNRIFNLLRTANLNISFNPVEWIFYHFRRVNSNISKDWMAMVMKNWLKLLAVWEKLSDNCFNLNGDSVWSVILVYSNKNITG